jgi:hypothetical protein
MKKNTIEQDTGETMRDIARFIESVAPGYGFSVLVFPHGQETRAAHYISNCHREDMIKVLREKADILENRLEIATIPGTAIT